MADLSNLEKSGVTRVVGGDEQFAADVVEESGIRKLRVKSDTNLSTDLVITTEYNQSLLISDTSWTTIFLKNGSPSTLSGAVIRFNKEAVSVRCLLDGIEIFNTSLSGLRSLVDLQSYSVPDGVYLKYKSDKRIFFYVPRFPQQVDSTIEFQAQADAGQVDVQYIAGIFQVS